MGWWVCGGGGGRPGVGRWVGGWVACFGLGGGSVKGWMVVGLVQVLVSDNGASGVGIAEFNALSTNEFTHKR